ncbi:hypothetical protein M885DRAFT_75725 [Pelagophyceae sp. CCMP2097]|nr:hypothetical protein M885DRAFT_75725 [Pelagophyceae sp. CCMP2097]
MGAGRSAQRSAQRRSDNDPSGGADNLAQRIRRSCSDPPAYKSSQTNTKRRASSAGSILRVVLPGSSEPDDDTKSETGFSAVMGLHDATGGRHMQVLNSILAEAHECALFRSFLDSEYCVELLDFVLVVHRFERLYSSLHSARPSTPNLKCEAGVIFNRFLKDASAPDYVSLVATEGVDLHLKNDTLNVKTFQAARTEAVVMRDAGSAQPNVESFLDALHDFEKYKRPAGAPTTDAQLLLIAKRVYDRFVAPASPASVGASSLLASRVRQKLEVGSIDADLFEPCRAEAARVLAETQFERFATWIEADETAAAHFRLDYVAQAAELAEAESVNAPPKKKPTSQPNSPQPKSSSRLNKSPKPESSSRLLESQRERRDSAMLLRVLEPF